MTDIQPDNSVQDIAASSTGTAPFSVGTALREARARLGLSVDEVSHRIKFAPRQIEALEADDFGHLPETAFLRGFVRSYARLLQLDPETLLAALPHAPVESVPLEAQALTEVPFPSADSERKQNILWLAGALVVVIALGIAAWLLNGKPKEQSAPEATVPAAQNPTVETLAVPEAVPVSAVPEAEPAMRGAEKPLAAKPQAEKPAAAMPAAEKSMAEKAAAEKSATEKKKTEAEKSAPPLAAPSVQPAAVPPAKPVVKPAPAAAAPGQASIRMTFDGDSWVEITDKNGKILLSQLHHAGMEQGINGTPPFSLVIGNAKAVHLYYKGQAVDLAPHTKIEVARLTLE